MDVKTVCLGMLTDGPMSGYDMKKQFESSFGHFFPAGYGSIYPALATLARNGLVEFEQIPQEGKPDRKVYSLTDGGRTALDEALEQSDATHKIRSEFMATIWFADLLSDERIDELINQRIDDIDALLDVLKEFPDCGCSSMPKGPCFVANFGRHMATAFREFLLANRDSLTSKDTKQTMKVASG